MATAAVSEALLTAEQYARRPDPGYPEELVRGRIVPLPQPNRRHGQICNKAGRILGNYAEEHDLGHVLSNNAGVITERDPDTVRGPDVAFYSYARLPRGPLPANYGPEVPELVVEVRSPTDRWPQVLARVAEYLEAGVTAVMVLDDDAPVRSRLRRRDDPDARPRRRADPPRTAGRVPRRGAAVLRVSETGVGRTRRGGWRRWLAHQCSGCDRKTPVGKPPVSPAAGIGSGLVWTGIQRGCFDSHYRVAFRLVTVR